MHIREIEVKDNKAIEKIIKQSLESFGLNKPGTAYFDPQLSHLAQFYKEQPYAKYWVAANGQEEVLGGIGIAPFNLDDGICELQKLYVSPDAQGRGVSKQLMEVALNFASEHYKKCYLETVEILKVANHLYRRFGFKQLERPLEGSGHNAMDTWFIKDLS